MTAQISMSITHRAMTTSSFRLATWAVWYMLIMNEVHVKLAIAIAPGLRLRYYDSTNCPNVEARARQHYNFENVIHPTLSGAMLRMVFHDCSVQGCDASILLDTNQTTGIQSELESRRNFGIRLMNVIDNIKAEFESTCPGVVSCADIVAMAGRDAISQAGGPDIPILTGRKDSRQASARLADISLLPATASMDQVLSTFADKGLTTIETVAIQGAHTLGVGHCQNFANRLYPQTDPMMPLVYSLLLKTTCPAPFATNTLITMPIDATTLLFDNRYYHDIKDGRGLFSVDAELATDPRTSNYVDMFAQNQGLFFEVFTSAFMKLTQHNALTGNNGEVRRNCHYVN